MRATPLAFRESGEGWHLAPRRMLLIKGAAIVLAGILALTVVDAARQGKWAAAVLVGLIALAFGALPFQRDRQRLEPRLHGQGADAGLLLPTHAMKVSTILALGLIGAVLAVGSVGVAVEAVATEGVGASVGPVVGGLLGLLFALLMLVGAYAGVVSRRRPDRGLLLTPHVLVLRTQRTPITVPWASVTRVRAHWGRTLREGRTTPGEVIHNWLTFETDGPAADAPSAVAALSGTQAPTLDASTLAVDPHLALAVCELYLAQPEVRGELGTSACLDRVAALRRAPTTTSPASAHPEVPYS